MSHDDDIFVKSRQRNRTVLDKCAVVFGNLTFLKCFHERTDGVSRLDMVKLYWFRGWCTRACTAEHTNISRKDIFKTSHGIFRKDLTMRGKCEGWDSNPRTPARPGPEPGAVDLAWLPSRLYRLRSRFNKVRGKRYRDEMRHLPLLPVCVPPEFPLPQFDPADLAGDGFWEGLDKLDRPRVLVGGCDLFYMVLEFPDQRLRRLHIRF